eukprot:TRINITY_DN8214_c0_g1_i3.p1 TRINITY_DN8214_c0_g1~~TRINITY_DN8214_c0_g1_i3.p1  ORF type:complete len:450 (-),score=71.74 TRINITY_DN8214_c0_g1_i3:109-1458(-)
MSFHGPDIRPKTASSAATRKSAEKRSETPSASKPRLLSEVNASVLRSQKSRKNPWDRDAGRYDDDDLNFHTHFYGEDRKSRFRNQDYEPFTRVYRPEGGERASELARMEEGHHREKSLERKARSRELDVERNERIYYQQYKKDAEHEMHAAEEDKRLREIYQAAFEMTKQILYHHDEKRHPSETRKGEKKLGKIREHLSAKEIKQRENEKVGKQSWVERQRRLPDNTFWDEIEGKVSEKCLTTLRNLHSKIHDREKYLRLAHQVIFRDILSKEKRSLTRLQMSHYTNDDYEDWLRESRVRDALALEEPITIRNLPGETHPRGRLAKHIRIEEVVPGEKSRSKSKKKVRFADVSGRTRHRKPYEMDQYDDELSIGRKYPRTIIGPRETNIEGQDLVDNQREIIHDFWNPRTFSNKENPLSRHKKLQQFSELMIEKTLRLCNTSPVRDNSF